MGNILPRSAPLFTSRAGVTLLGGGVLGPGDLAAALALAPDLVAVDGGAQAALRAGHTPRAVYGDMDSLGPVARAAIPPDRLHPIAEQETTDFDKALRHIAAPLVIAVGFTGARVDHELAVYHGLVAGNGPPVVVLSAADCIAHLAAPLRLGLPIGTRLSLFPMAHVTGRSEGLAWPIDGLTFHPAHRIGTSNATAAPEVRLACDGPGMLLILPRAHLGALAAACRTAAAAMTGADPNSDSRRPSGTDMTDP